MPNDQKLLFWLAAIRLRSVHGVGLPRKVGSRSALVCRLAKLWRLGSPQDVIDKQPQWIAELDAQLANLGIGLAVLRYFCIWLPAPTTASHRS